MVKKTFERLVLSCLKDITDPLLDPLLFAYREKKEGRQCSQCCTASCITSTPRDVHKILFVDFSLGSDTIIPEILYWKLTQLRVATSTSWWIVHVLTERRQ